MGKEVQVLQSRQPNVRGSPAAAVHRAFYTPKGCLAAGCNFRRRIECYADRNDDHSQGSCWPPRGAPAPEPHTSGLMCRTSGGSICASWPATCMTRWTRMK
jgi:hypothetical protein